MQILLDLAQVGVETMIRWADACWRCGIPTQVSNLSHQRSGDVALPLNRSFHRRSDAAKKAARKWNHAIRIPRKINATGTAAQAAELAQEL